MHVFHPPQAINGIPPENYFLIADSANLTVAQGFLTHTYHPYLFPERPVHIYLGMNAQGPGRDMLLGALLARAQQLRAQTPQYLARIFTQVSAQDAHLLSFYLDSGFQADDALDVVELRMPNTRPNRMGYEISFLPLSAPTEQQMLLYRMNTYRLAAIQPQFFQRCMATPHFLALRIARGGEVAGEIVFAGEGGAARLIGLHVTPNYRRMGLGKTLVAAGMKYLAEQQGVSRFEGEIIRRNAAQCALGQACNATFIRTACFYPGINDD